MPATTAKYRTVHSADGITITTSDPLRCAPDGRHYILATYKSSTPIASPFDAPIFGRAVPRTTGWRCEVELQAVGHGEIEALTNLLESLPDLGLDVPVPALDVLAALMSTTKDSPWNDRPMGDRGYKPKPPRHDFVDAVTGERIVLYKDTMKRHRDPLCQCPHCIAITGPTTP